MDALRAVGSWMAGFAVVAILVIAAIIYWLLGFVPEQRSE
jgi:hypothetical protein